MNSEKNYKDLYVYGSAAPARINEEPVYAPEREKRNRRLTKEDARKELSKHYASEQIQKTSKIGILNTVAITAAIVVTLIVATNYVININLDKRKTSEITALRQELSELEEINDHTKMTIDTSVDYNYIYDVAVNELGMVHIDSDHVIKYESGESEYVIQFNDIPVSK